MNMLMRSAIRESFNTEYIICETATNALSKAVCDRFIQS